MFISSLVYRRDEFCSEYLYYLLIPLSFECLRQANTRGLGIWPNFTILFERLDQSFVGFIRKVAFSRQNTLAVEELAHCSLRDISGDRDER